VENDKEDMDDRAQINLDCDEAVVLFELLSRWSNSKPPETPDSACFESTAEGAVLNTVLYSLERQLVAPFKPDYDLILRRARKALALQWDYPTLSG